MLIEFTVGNFRSIRNKVTLSLVASSIKEHCTSNTMPLNSKTSLLKSAVIYGANASGKSNVLKALRFMRKFVINSSKDMQANEAIDVVNFKLSCDTESSPSSFEVIFCQESLCYKYGFEVTKNEVLKEWLYYYNKNKEIKLFLRTNDQFDLGDDFKEGEDIIRKTRQNALFLSVVAQFNGEIAQKILRWFNKVRYISGLNDNSYMRFTVSKLSDKEFKEKIMEFVRSADVWIDDIQEEKKKINPEEIRGDIPDHIRYALVNEGLSKISTSHKKYIGENRTINISFDISEESEGTQKILALSGPIVDTLQNGYILVVDELDSRLHPLLTQLIIKLFNSSDNNAAHAQLIFASHDVNSLDKSIFRRDQVWFTEKDMQGATQLYSLAEYKSEKKKIRNDATYRKDYILGKYGAIPKVDTFASIVKKIN